VEPARLPAPAHRGEGRALDAEGGEAGGEAGSPPERVTRPVPPGIVSSRPASRSALTPRVPRRVLAVVDGFMPRDLDSIRRELAAQEAALAEAERRRDEARARVEALRAELSAATRSSPAPAAPMTSARKVELFLSLFRGRPDVYPVRFEGKRTGKAGYAPACSNKFEPGRCALKTGGRCSDCSHPAFMPVTARAALDHLQGRQVMGVYPLLEDETCWFLAADFDGGAWREDVAAFAETCRARNLPVAIERSRSGNGAHAWFFFAEPVPAATARRMGCFLITETMDRRHQLAMKSYDRLFPNQDTLPRGGFGNLIALPLQQGPRQQGNSVFVDDRFEPHPDQWAFLASLARIDGRTVEALAEEAVRGRRVLGVRSADAADDDEEAAVPWLRPPSGRTPPNAPTFTVPPEVRAVLAQRLFVEKEGLPSPVLNRLQRLAAFQNPAFYAKQRMRLSTGGTPRVICCAEDLPRFVALPRGLANRAERLFADHGARLVVEDARTEGSPVAFEFRGELTAVQEEAARALLAHDTGVFVAPPGIGKTVLGTYLVARRGRSTLVLVHRRPLLEQWVAQLAMFLGIDEKEVGRIGGGKRKPNGRLDVAMIQSLVRRDEVDDLVAGYGHVIVDECHHLPAVSFERVLAEVKARYVLGLTATPQRRDGHHPIAEMQLGPIRFRVDAKSQAARRPFAHELIVRETGFRLPAGGGDASIQEVYGALAADEARNRRIVDDVLAAMEEGRSPIVLTERKDHLELLAERLRPAVRHLVVLQGGLSARKRRAAAERLAAIPAVEERLVLATGRFVGEGFDDARLDTLFLAMPVSWKGTLTQYAGRLHRLHPGKKEVRIYDYVDREVPQLLRMFERRLPTYRAIGYARGEAPLGFAEPSEEPVVEYDEEALRHVAGPSSVSSRRWAHSHEKPLLPVQATRIPGEVRDIGAHGQSPWPSGAGRSVSTRASGSR
jgi:superfamily II DNA or RNA helicase